MKVAASNSLYNLLLLFVVFTFIGCANNSEPDEHIVAQIEDFKVTEQHFKNAFLKYYYKTGRTLEQNLPNKEAVLKSEFEPYVLAVYARDLGIDKTPTAYEKFEEIRRRVLTEEYKEQYILADLEITERNLEEVFVRFNTTFEAAHLYAPTKEIADSLYDLIQQGYTFDELAPQVFRNPKLAKTGGDLGRFTVDEMDLAFEDEIFRMKEGEISEPVKTAQGYSIIKLKERFTKPILTEYEFASKKDQFRAFARKQAMERKTREHMYAFTNEIDFNKSMVNWLWDQVKMGKLNFEYANSENTPTLENNEASVAEFYGLELSVNEFFQEAALTSQRSVNLIRTKDQFKNFITGLAYRNYMMEKAIAHGLDEQEEVQASIEYTWQIWLSKQAIEQLRDSIELTDAELKETYRAKQSLFQKPLELNLSRIAVEDEETAKEVKEKLLNGADFKEMVYEYSIHNEERLFEGELGYQSIKEFGFLSPKLSSISKGEISEVLFYQTGEYHIYKCLGRIEARPLSFEEARPQVISYLKRKKLKELRTETIAKVKRDHNAYVDMEKLKDITIQI